MGFGTSLFLIHDSIVLYFTPTSCHSFYLLPCPLPPHVCMQGCVCRPVCLCMCTQHTHAYTHTHLSTPDFVVKALGIFKRNQCVFVVVATSKFLIPGTSKEPAIHCLYSILGAKNFWKHFRRFPKFILSWNLLSDSWLPVFQPSQHGVLNIAQVFPNSSTFEYFVHGKWN